MTLRRTPFSTAVLFAAAIVLLLCAVSPTKAFGAGNIPSYSHLEGKAWRHGDIDDTIAQLSKKAGGLLGRGAKFSGLDVKRIYFGSYLADLSQAMDIGSLERVSAQKILNIIMLMAFMAFGYATGDFEVTLERLGAYLPVEHIDNPKGYGGDKDPRQTDPRLRPPVDKRELLIDERTGMKNYIANESGTWDTSSALVRRRLVECISLGRQARSSGDSSTLHEAYRLLGRSLHTLEDFPAHSNFCELALIKHGHQDVFPHVGDDVKIRAPDGTLVSPLVTGTFGGADFIHSLLGEASNHLSSASVSEIEKTVRDASAQGSGSMRDFLSVLGKVPGSSAAGLSRDAQELSNGTSRDPDTMDPHEIYQKVYKIMAFRDRVMMTIEETIEKIPGLGSLIEKISNTLSVFVYTLLEPYVTPIIKQALSGLQMGSSQVISEQDQYEVFNNRLADDPTHSLVSKDEFSLILNEPSGNIACIIVRHVVTLVVSAFDSDCDAQQTADECLAVLFHPAWPTMHPVQTAMINYMEEWGRKNASEVRKLDRQHVRSHTNTRSGKAEVHLCGGGGGGGAYGFQANTQQGYTAGSGLAHHVQNYVGGQIQHAVGPMAGHIPGSSSILREASGSAGHAHSDQTQAHGSNMHNSFAQNESNPSGSSYGDQHAGAYKPGSLHQRHPPAGESSSYFSDNYNSSALAPQHSSASSSGGPTQGVYGQQYFATPTPPTSYGSYGQYPGPAMPMPQQQAGTSCTQLPDRYGPPHGGPPSQPPYVSGPQHGYHGGAPGYNPPYGPPPPGPGYY